VPIDLAQAQTLFEQAARKGHVDAATTLGVLLFQNGNRAAAIRWLRQAANAGKARAMLLYGTALYNGDGVAPDPATAYAYVSRAAARGFPPRAQRWPTSMRQCRSASVRKGLPRRVQWSA